MANVSTDYKLRKARLSGLKTDRIYYCYGIYDGIALLLYIYDAAREKSVCVSFNGEKYYVDFTGIKRAPIEMLVSTGNRLGNSEKRMIRDKRRYWKEKLISKRRQQDNMNIHKRIVKNKSGENKQFIRIVSGGLVRPK